MAASNTTPKPGSRQAADAAAFKGARAKAAPAPAPKAVAQENPLMGKLDEVRQDEARRLGLDLDLLSAEELRAFAAGGAAGLGEHRAKVWDEEAAKRPRQANLMD